MLATMEQVMTEVDVTRVEITTWIERRWVLPVEREGRYLFDEADRARIQLIAELHRDLEVGNEAMPMILRLLDQIYTLRRVLAELQDAIKDLPAGVQAELGARLRKPPEA